MANRKKTQVDSEYGKAPETLDGHPFYGLDVSDPEQIVFRDALWDKQYRFVGVDACSGSGKTTLSVATGVLACKYGLMDGLFYVRCPLNEERRLGFLPGDLSSKTKFYTTPLVNTLMNIGENPFTALDDDISNQKNGSAYISCMTDVYLRGDDFSRKFIIVDEAQNATEEQLRTIITRAHDDCCVVVIGSTIQCDMEDKSKSGFAKCLKHFSKQPWAKICTLSKNYRGEMSAWADLSWNEGETNN